MIKMIGFKFFKEKRGKRKKVNVKKIDKNDIRMIDIRIRFYFK